MNAWEVQSCRGCLLQDNVSAMYDLTVPETSQLFSECSSTDIWFGETDNVPQFICNMCYRICELWLGFRERCMDSEKKFKRVATTKRKIFPVSAMKSERIPADPLPVTSFNESGTYWSSDGDDDVEEQVETDWPETKYQTMKKRAKKRKKGPVNSPNALKVQDIDQCSGIIFGPGPNDKGVWPHFLRSTCKNFSKCKICGRVLKLNSGSTGSMNNHIKLVHKHEYYQTESLDNTTANQSSDTTQTKDDHQEIIEEPPVGSQQEPSEHKPGIVEDENTLVTYANN